MTSNPFPAGGQRPVRVWTAIVDQHATWIAVNPVQGCPKSCRYCFLNERGQTAVRPETLASPARSVELLLACPHYTPERPVAYYTWTDAMALPTTREHLKALLGELTRRGVPNPVVLITKCRVPDDVIAAITAAIRDGLRVLVYLSYSGLSGEVERGIRHEDLRENFPRLADAGVPIVHYWRPAFPRSATPETMTAVLDWAAAHARCTVAAGLKVEAAALPGLARLWPELATTPEVDKAECVYPRAFWDFIHATAATHPTHPLFHTNSCALAYVLGRTDRFGVFDTPVCATRNHCPTGQRDLCRAAARRRRPVREQDVAAALARHGHPDAAFTLDPAAGEVIVRRALPTNVAAALTQDLATRVRVQRQEDDPYWSSGTAGALPLVLDGAR
ncbi:MULTISPECIES: hypothetical protein [Actinosynnema]|uniref:hypothetical protein n=1 Tax=Actinosynnema TaxID=40566 RepID=UPI0020A54D04|nr:hypothetical protein [Actinosynnema pretiosum]MCP2094724.1 DNA repair photolyase [Actinosynnema pretiosum]